MAAAPSQPYGGDRLAPVDERTQMVAAGYDRMADRFADWAAHVEQDPREPVPLQYPDSAPELGVRRSHAALSYSLISPPRTGL